MPAAVLGVTKNQRLNHHRHRLRVGQLLADVDKIEILEIDAIDRNDAGSGYQFALYDIAHEFGDIRIEDQNQRLPLINVRLHRADQALRPKCGLEDKPARAPSELLMLPRDRDHRASKRCNARPTAALISSAVIASVCSICGVTT